MKPLFLALLLFFVTDAQAVTISWPAAVVDSNHDAAANYDVRRKQAGGNYVSIAIVTALSYNDTLAGAPASTTYTYQVFPCNTGGCAAGSNEVSYTTPAAPLPSGSVFVPPSAQIVDARNRVLTLGLPAHGGNFYIMADGQYDGGAEAVLLAKCSSVSYHKNSGGEWYRETATSWTYIGKAAPCQ